MNYCESDEDHEWIIDSPGVVYRQLYLYCSECDATADAVIAKIHYELEDDD